MSRRKVYVKTESECYLGEGFAFIEYTDDRATRQVEQYGEYWLSSNNRYEVHPGVGPGLCELSLSDTPVEDGDEVISQSEFERVWQIARSFKEENPDFPPSSPSSDGLRHYFE